MRYALGTVLVALLGACTRTPAQPAASDVAPAKVAAEAEPEPGPAPWNGEAPFEAPRVIVLSDEAGVLEVEVQIDAVPGVRAPTGAVPFTAEPYIVNAPPQDFVEEANILGTGLALDLDGDGKLGGSFATSCDERGIASVGETRLAPLASELGGPRVYDPTKIVAMSASGSQAIMYGPCGEQGAGVGMSRPGDKIEILEERGPLLQLLVLEEVAGPDAAPKSNLRVEPSPGAAPAKLYLDHDFESLGRAPTWHAVQWTMIALDPDAAGQKVRAKLVGHTDAFRVVVAGIDLSDTPGVRIRSVTSAHELEPGS